MTCKTNLHYGRNVDGILLLDKPQGLSSNASLQKVKRLFMSNKAGYSGTLDPIATGMLPIFFGEATKFAQYFSDSEKHYRVIARLGERTNTSDIEGQIICVRPVRITLDHLEQSLEYFRGKTWQVPSMFSALKYHGCPLYLYARQGIRVPRKKREINIYDLKLIRWDFTSIELDIRCSKGTYIRTIIDDLGELLGCGAHVIGLRRLGVAHYSEKQMVTISDIQQKIVDFSSQTKCSQILSEIDKMLFPLESSVLGMPIVNLPTTIASLVRMGRMVTVINSLKEGKVCITEGDAKRFLGIGIIHSPGSLSPYRLISQK